MRSRLVKTSVLVAAAGAVWTHMARVNLRLDVRRRLSLKCLFLGHEDWIRRTSDRLYLECFECGRETGGEGGPVTTVTFEEKGGKTLLVMHELYSSKEALDAAGTGAADAMVETFEQLDELLVTLGASVGRS